MHVVDRQPKERRHDFHNQLTDRHGPRARDPCRGALPPVRRPPRAAADRIVLRRARPADHAAVRRVAQLDSAKAPSSPTLIAEVDGEIVAAAPIDGGAPVADPFRPTADVIVLLERRARQLRRAA